jgi:hypothetical protein
LPQEIAETLAFLMPDDAAYTTGGTSPSGAARARIES